MLQILNVFLPMLVAGGFGWMMCRASSRHVFFHQWWDVLVKAFWMVLPSWAGLLFVAAVIRGPLMLPLWGQLAYSGFLVLLVAVSMAEAVHVKPPLRMRTSDCLLQAAPFLLLMWLVMVAGGFNAARVLMDAETYADIFPMLLLGVCLLPALTTFMTGWFLKSGNSQRNQVARKLERSAKT